MAPRTPEEETRHPDRIDLGSAYEADWWARKLGVTCRELTDAVERAGSSCEAVARALGKQA